MPLASINWFMSKIFCFYVRLRYLKKTLSGLCHIGSIKIQCYVLSWPETTGHTKILLLAQGFRNDLSFCPDPRKSFYFNEIAICKLYHELHRGKIFVMGLDQNKGHFWNSGEGEGWCDQLFPVTLTLNSDRSNVGLILDAFAQAGIKSSQGSAMALRIDNLPSTGAKRSSLNVETYK